MLRRRVQIALAVVDAVAAVTAVGGGVALASGLEADRLPVEWLRGTPFSSYVLPGLILGTAVGGCATIATVTTVRDPVVGGRASMLAGLAMSGWIVGEIALLTNDGELVSGPEAAYFAVGLAMLGLGMELARQPAMRPRVPQPGAAPDQGR